MVQHWGSHQRLLPGRMGNLIKYKKLMLMLSILHWKQLLAFFPTQIRPSIHSVPLRCIATTQYTIEEVGVDPKVLEKTILKHCQNLDLFLESKPIAAHTQEAFSALQDALAIVKQAPIILDRYDTMIDHSSPIHVKS